MDTSAGESTVFVHRWTAIELHRRWTDRDQHDQLLAAHLSAADYWQWRVRVWPQNRARDLDDLLEARYHLLVAGKPDDAATLTEWVCTQLHDWSSWDHEEALIHDTLKHLPASSDRLPAWLTQLADIAAGRGRLSEAADRYQQALTIREKLVRLDPENTSYQRDLSISYNKLAGLDEAAGRLSEAADRYQQALTIAEKLVRLDPENTSYQRDLSISYGMLGGLDEAMGRPGEAIERYRQGLAICERLTKLNPAIVIYRQDLRTFHARLENLEREPRASWLSRLRRRVRRQ